jgi:hypothetical protein
MKKRKCETESEFETRKLRLKKMAKKYRRIVSKQRFKKLQKLHVLCDDCNYTVARIHFLNFVFVEVMPIG